MNKELLSKINILESQGWKFTHLMGQKMSANNRIECFIVDCSTSVEGYKKLLNLIASYKMNLVK